MRLVIPLACVVLIVAPVVWFLSASDGDMEQTLESGCASGKRQFVPETSARKRAAPQRRYDPLSRGETREPTAQQPLATETVHDEQLQNVLWELADTLRQLNAEREANERLSKQLLALLTERAEGLLERYLQSHEASSAQYLDRMRGYLASAYRLGLDPDLAQVERLEVAVREIVPQLDSNVLSFPEGYDANEYRWQPPQFDLIGWRHDRQLELSTKLELRVANSLGVTPDVLFPEEKE